MTRPAATGAIAAIDLDDELDAERQISVETSANRHLPAKESAELARVERGPQTSFRHEAQARRAADDVLAQRLY